jgi:hypothetical protein
VRTPPSCVTSLRGLKSRTRLCLLLSQCHQHLDQRQLPRQDCLIRVVRCHFCCCVQKVHLPRHSSVIYNCSSMHQRDQPRRPPWKRPCDLPFNGRAEGADKQLYRRGRRDTDEDRPCFYRCCRVSSTYAKCVIDMVTRFGLPLKVGSASRILLSIAYSIDYLSTMTS